jgi:hypothetical protein
MAGVPLPSRQLKNSQITIEFGAISGIGAVGDIILFNITGRCLVTHFAVGCSESLLGAATMSIGPPNNDEEFLPDTTATDLDSGNWWDSATPQAQAGNAITDKTIGPVATTNVNTLLLNIESAAITDGTIHVFCIWLPLSGDGNIAAAIPGTYA